MKIVLNILSIAKGILLPLFYFRILFKLMIPFNKAYTSPKAGEYLQQVFQSGKLAGDGAYTKKCHTFFKDKYNFNSFLTTSCTDALEMAALLLNIKKGDEVIMPSFNFVSTANAFVLRGATIVFADSSESRPNMDAEKIEELITAKTKAIVPVHYGGVATDMDKLMAISKKAGIAVVENAAHAIDAFYKGKPLGGIGSLSAFSFHETKNITCGEGGLLTVNDKNLIKRAEVIREKGTNRSAYFRGEVDKYGWVEPGSSFLPADILAAILYAQLEELEQIQQRRLQIWNRYYEGLKELEQQGMVQLPVIPEYSQHNGHIFYLLLKNEHDRDAFINHIKKGGAQASFHYGALHHSKYFKDQYKGGKLINAERFANCLVRLPLFYQLKNDEIDYIVALTYKFFR